MISHFIFKTMNMQTKCRAGNGVKYCSGERLAREVKYSYHARETGIKRCSIWDWNSAHTLLNVDWDSMVFVLLVTS